MKRTKKLTCQCNGVESKLIWHSDDGYEEPMFCAFCGHEIEEPDDLEDEDDE